MRRPQTGPSKGPNEVLTARVVFLSGDPCPRVGPGAYNHEVRPRHRRHAYRCRAGVLPCPGPRTARRRSELNATPRLPATAQATTLTQSNPFPRSATDLPEMTRSAAVVIAAAPLDVPEEADPESPDAAPPPARHRLMAYRRGGGGVFSGGLGAGGAQGRRRLEPPGRQPPCARPGKVECAGLPGAGTAP